MHASCTLTLLKGEVIIYYFVTSTRATKYISILSGAVVFSTMSSSGDESSKVENENQMQRRHQLELNSLKKQLKADIKRGV